MRLRSIRQVVLVPVLITFALGFSMFAFYADRTVRQSQLQDIEQELQRAEAGSNLVAGPRGRPPGQAAGSGDDAGPAPQSQTGVDGAAAEVDSLAPITLLVSADAEVLAESGRLSPFSTGDLQQLVAAPGFTTLDDYRILTTVRADDQVLVTALSLDATNQAASDFRRALLLGGASIFALVGAALWVLTSRLVRPVRDMADSVADIAAGDLDVSIQAGGSHEMVHLATDIDHMVATLKHSIGEEQRSAAEATAARATMQRLLADLAHELRTPLTALKGYSDLYANGMLELDGALDRAMERVGSESDRLHRMAADMLQIARGQEAESDAEMVDVGVIAERVVADLRAAFPELAIELDMAPTAGQWVHGLPGPLHQAILNVGSNACEHSTDDGAVTIGVSCLEQAIVVRVVDHGPGIAEVDRARIFSPFFRADASRHRSGTSGAGLGLTLVRSIVERHDGSVHVEDTPGGGATLVIALPAHAAA